MNLVAMLEMFTAKETMPMTSVTPTPSLPWIEASIVRKALVIQQNGYHQTKPIRLNMLKLGLL